jgi:DNA-binding transcriptional regulator PaaX
MRKSPKISKKILDTLSDKPATPISSLENELLEAFLDDFDQSGSKQKYAITRAFKNLTDSGYVEVIYSDNAPYARLTRDGRHKKHSMTLDNEGILVPTAWDGFWRIVMLDLPESRKNERESLRYLLKKAGFVCIKNAMWVSPYPYEHLFTNIKKDLGLQTELMIIVTNTLDPETEKVFLQNIQK